EPVEVPGNQRLVQTKLSLDSVDGLLIDIRLGAQLRERVAGAGHHHENQEASDQQDRNRYRQTAKDVENQVQRLAPSPGIARNYFVTVPCHGSGGRVCVN